MRTRDTIGVGLVYVFASVPAFFIILAWASLR
jgi:hypothetical protein